MSHVQSQAGSVSKGENGVSELCELSQSLLVCQSAVLTVFHREFLLLPVPHRDLRNNGSNGDKYKQQEIV